LSHREIVKDTLKYRYNHSKEAVFWLENQNLIPAAQLVLSFIDDRNGSVTLGDIEILKKDNKRLILRVKTRSFGKKSFVVKVSLLHSFKQRLKYHLVRDYCYGFSEVPNLIIANKRGLNVPKVFGYGRIYGSFWLTRASIIILEDLANHISTDELLKLRDGNEEKCAEILDYTIPLFIRLYEAKCDNLDINPHAIMLSS